jgi:heme-degrading monooxygenase HmoA
MDVPGTPAPAPTPPAPYFAVIFTATRNEQPGDGFAETDERMFALAREQPGFLGYDTTAGAGLGITVSYWATEDAIAAWKAKTEHVAAQREGRARWFDSYIVRVARVERAYGFTRPAQ